MPIRALCAVSFAFVLAACSSSGGTDAGPMHTYACDPSTTCTQDQACVEDAYPDGGGGFSCGTQHGCGSLVVYCGAARSAVCNTLGVFWTDVDASDVDFGSEGISIDDAGVYGGGATFVICQATH